MSAYDTEAGPTMPLNSGLVTPSTVAVGVSDKYPTSMYVTLRLVVWS
jgi:hypothetical protein